MAVDEVEQKFLDAIAAHPGDREARSVYADWLDERGDPRGEYLRLELQLHEIPARMAALAPHIEDAWIAQIARLCDVVLYETGPNKISVIKEIRLLSGVGLKEAKDLAEAASHLQPKRVREAVPATEAKDAAARFAEVGALVRVLAHDGDHHLRPPPKPIGPASNPPAPLDHYEVVITAVADKLRTIVAVRELTQLGLKPARDLVERVASGPQRVLETHSWSEAERAVARLRPHCTVERR